MASIARSCEIIETMLDDVAGVLAEYRKSLVKKGFSEEDAMKLVAQYHEALMGDISESIKENDEA